VRRRAERGTYSSGQPAAEDGGVAWQRPAAPAPSLGLASDDPLSWGAPDDGREGEVDTLPRLVEGGGLLPGRRLGIQTPWWRRQQRLGCGLPSQWASSGRAAASVDRQVCCLRLAALAVEKVSEGRAMRWRHSRRSVLSGESVALSLFFLETVYMPCGEDDCGPVRRPS
jgi:hypothetical protein